MQMMQELVQAMNVSSFGISLVNLSVTIVAFTILWLINVRIRDAGVVDYYWGIGFAVIAWISLGLGVFDGISTINTLKIVFATVVTLWAFRLAGQLIWRHKGSGHEDARYAAMRESGGENFWWKSLFTIFTLQAVILWLVATPVYLAMVTDNTSPITPLFWLGMVIAVFGIVIESVADWQLYRGKKDIPEGTTFRGGLWGYSRHPNYFGELMCWAGLSVAAFALSLSVWVFIGPALLSVAILGISLPLTEVHMLKSRRDYPEYMDSVPKLVPSRTQTPQGGTDMDAAE